MRLVCLSIALVLCMHAVESRISEGQAGKGSVKTFGGNSNNASCHFPFTYKKQQHSRCIWDKDHYWCSTTPDYDKDKKMGVCYMPMYTYDNLKDGLGAEQAKAKGAPCVFPFTRRGKEYTYGNCFPKKMLEDASRDYGICPTKTAIDINTDDWGICGRELVFTLGGNAKREPCVFPFKWKGELRSKCIKENEFDTTQKICAVTNDLDKDRKWGKCIKKQF